MAIPIQRACVNGVRMQYFCFGRGKETMVILPGLSVQSVMQSADAVAHAYAPLTDDFTIWLFDRRENLPPDYSVFDMARDTAAVIKQIGLRSISLFGVSQGGMIAMALAAAEPLLVKKLALGSTSAQIEPPQRRVIENWIRLAAEQNGESLFLDFGKRLYPQPMFESLQEWLKKAGKQATSAQLERFAMLADAAKGFSFLDKLETIRCPVFAIGAADDAVLGCAATRAIAERLQGRSDFEAYIYEPGFGHAAYDTAPDYKERLRTFFLFVQPQTDKNAVETRAITDENPKIIK